MQSGTKYRAGQLDWDDNHGEFCTDPTFAKFPGVMVFDEHDEGDKIAFHHFSVTLHSVPDGNVKIIPISKDEFLHGNNLLPTH